MINLTLTNEQAAKLMIALNDRAVTLEMQLERTTSEAVRAIASRQKSEAAELYNITRDAYTTQGA
jgi:hypothetical protein